jgi:hypothetical protein
MFYRFRSFVSFLETNDIHGKNPVNRFTVGKQVKEQVKRPSTRYPCFAFFRAAVHPFCFKVRYAKSDGICSDISQQIVKKIWTARKAEENFTAFKVVKNFRESQAALAVLQARSGV